MTRERRYVTSALTILYTLFNKYNQMECDMQIKRCFKSELGSFI